MGASFVRGNFLEGDFSGARQAEGHKSGLSGCLVENFFHI